MSIVQSLIAVINFRETVPLLQGVRVTKSFRLGGKITQIMFHFPPGCNSLVHVKLLKNYENFVPIQGDLALDDFTPLFAVNVNYDEYEPLSLEIENRDSGNPHTIECDVVIQYNESV